MTKLFELGAVEIDTVGVESIVLDQVQTQSIDYGPEKAIIRPNGTVEAKFVGLMQQLTKITFSSQQLKTGLDNVGISPIKIDVSTGNPGVTLWFLQLEDGENFYAGAKHVKVTINKGILIPRTVSGSQGEIAQMTFEIIPTWDLTNDPLVIEKNQTYAVTPAADEQYTVGPLEIESLFIDTVESHTVNFGIQEKTKITGGNIFPTFTGHNSAQAMNQHVTNDADYQADYDQSGAAISDPFNFWFRKKAADGAGNVADATEEHIQFTVNKGHHCPMSAEGSIGGEATVGIEVTVIHDGTNARYVVDTTAAIA